MKSTIPRLLLRAVLYGAVLGAVHFAIGQSSPFSKIYTYPGTGMAKSEPDGVRITTTDYTRTQDCINDITAEAARRKDAGINVTPTPDGQRLQTKLKCQVETIYVFEWEKPVAPPVVVAPTTTPGIGKLPTPSKLNDGFSTDRVSASNTFPNNASDGQGDFRTRCAPSHFLFDDPIVFPGQVGRSHLHVFFGNTSASAASTAESLRTTGNSTCRGGTANRSSYWIPAVIDTATMFPVKPDESDFYYKTAYKGVQNAQIQPMPVGLRMIAGDPSNKTQRAEYDSPYVFLCHNMPYTENRSNRSQNIPTSCPVGDQMEFSIAFPQCWDGVNLDSPDHKSHMAYANGSGCPPTHPVALPEVSFHVLFPVPANGDLRTWRLSSDVNGYPSGLSAHADWFNGWQKEISDTWAVRCDRAGKDCQSHMLGDGRTIY